jgi:nicotinate-nucleotide pyrophosphorylase (carboxylating)
MTQLSPDIVATICRALEEDIRDGDVTAECTVPADMMLSGRFIAKAEGIVAGLAIAEHTFKLLDADAAFTPLVRDGERVSNRQTLATVSGKCRALLSGERTALNFMQRMSGIATAADRFVQAIAAAGGKARILDTRKTVPGLRLLDKMAFKIGGGVNHRIGLFDMVMIKNNHIAACGGSITKAVAAVRACDARKRPIEVEVRDFAELEEALANTVDRIMLDNMSVDDMRKAVALVNGRTPLEASGNVTLDTVGAIAATGVDFISTGAVTHSVKALDISLWLDEAR